MHLLVWTLNSMEGADHNTVFVRFLKAPGTFDT